MVLAMANKNQVDLLKRSVKDWNSWRASNPTIGIDLTNCDLRGLNLNDAFLSGADLQNSDLRGAFFTRANLSNSKLQDANLEGAYLTAAYIAGANLTGACLRNADLHLANLDQAILSNADLMNADLSQAILRETELSGTNISDCKVFGISAWKLNLEKTIQKNLMITEPIEPIITVDNLEVAQFIYLLLHNSKIRNVIDTITSKVVLILGRFTPERKIILDGIREELRKYNYSPVLFDFEKPANRDITETISTLAHMARFVIADITDAKSIPQELKTIVPSLPSVPIAPLIQSGNKEYGMFEHFRNFPWVLSLSEYRDWLDLKTFLLERIINTAEEKARELISRR
jgi:Pentapeptide repeats (8 copies)